MKNLTLALVALLLVPGLALAQDTKQEDAVSTWINTLIAKMDAKDETITRSVDRALSAMGDKALPALEKVAGGEDWEQCRRG